MANHRYRVEYTDPKTGEHKSFAATLGATDDAAGGKEEKVKRLVMQRPALRNLSPDSVTVTDTGEITGADRKRMASVLNRAARPARLVPASVANEQK